MDNNDIPEHNKKFSMSTTSDLHFDMLADQTKVKILPPSLIEQQSIKLNENDQVNEIANNSGNNSDSESESDSSESYKKSSKKSSNNSSSESNDSPNFYGNNNNMDSFHSTTNENKVPTFYSNNSAEKTFDQLDEQTQRIMRMEKYAELISIKRSGITLTKEYSITSNYDEMCFEVDYWNNYQKKKDAVELGKNFLVNAITAIEFLNESYDPFGLKLKGWSESVELNKNSYQSVFEELYEKYKMSGRKLEPELKLLFMVSASAASFHASKKMAESLPGLDSVLQSNPDLLAKLQGAINSQISGDAQKEKDKEDKEEQQRKMYQQMKELKEQQRKFEELQKAQDTVNRNTENIKQQMEMMNKKTKQPVKKQQEKPDISNILNKIKAQNAARKADEVINNNLSDSSSDEKISINEKINDQSDEPSDSYTQTIGSDGKPTRRKRGTKSTISIITK